MPHTFHTTHPPQAGTIHDFDANLSEQARKRYENFRQWVANEAPYVPELNQSPNPAPEAPGYATI